MRRGVTGATKTTLHASNANYIDIFIDIKTISSAFYRLTSELSSLSQVTMSKEINKWHLCGRSAEWLLAALEPAVCRRSCIAGRPKFLAPCSDNVSCIPS
jgi:hypothetical protein